MRGPQDCRFGGFGLHTCSWYQHSALATVVGPLPGLELSPEPRFEDWSKLLASPCTSMAISSSLGVALSLEPGVAPGAGEDPLDDTANK